MFTADNVTIDPGTDRYGPHLMINNGSPAVPLYRSAMPSMEIAHLLAASAMMLGRLREILSLPRNADRSVTLKPADLSLISAVVAEAVPEGGAE